MGATQRLLDAALGSNIDRFVYASSSSVYGNAASYPTHEDDAKRPRSPYGVTKLGGELLTYAYASNFGVPSVALRYFTVYGPRQRPDMAIHRIIEAAIEGRPFALFGDGSQVRDFTFVTDVVRANILAATTSVEPGAVLNVAGGASTTMMELIRLVGSIVGKPVLLNRQAEQAGDVLRTGGSIALAAEVLGWQPRMDLASGVAAQVAWHRSFRADP